MKLTFWTCFCKVTDTLPPYHPDLNPVEMVWPITLHCIAFPGSRVSRSDCRMWNMSYKYKHMYSTVQLEFPHKQLGLGISPVTRLLPTEDNTNTEETRTDIHASSGIRSHDPSVWGGEDISCLRPRGHCVGPIQFKHKMYLERNYI
jgi:hypothetical protein